MQAWVGYGTESAWKHGMGLHLQPNQCPACHVVYDDATPFQPPVRSCLPCYIRLPANRDLWELLSRCVSIEEKQRVWLETRHRALRAKYARRKAGEVKRELALGGALGSPLQTAKPALVDILHEGALLCDGCGVEDANEKFPLEPFTDTSFAITDLEPTFLFCGRCKLKAMKGDMKLKCQRCFELFSVTDLHRSSKPDKQYCTPCWGHVPEVLR